MASDLTLTVVGVADHNYVKYSEVLTASLHLNYPEAELVWYLVGISEDDKPRIEHRLHSLHDKIEIIHDDSVFVSPEDKQAYCANIRVRLLRRLLQRGTQRLLYVDADSIVRKRLDAIMEALEIYEILIHLRMDNPDERLKVATGVIGVRNTDAANRFFLSWEAAIEEHLYSWYADQVSFYETFSKLHDSMRIGGLEHKFIDWEFRQPSPIWTGKGCRKDRNKLYVLEDKKYRHRIDGRSTFWIQLAITALEGVVRTGNCILRIFGRGTWFGEAIRRGR